MFALCSSISIGKFTKVKPHEVKITKSIHEYVEKAVIKLPISARLKQADGCTETVETAKQFDEGDAVTIDLGYNGSLKNEFIGFVSRVNFTTPLEVECEGYSYQLRVNNYQKTFTNTTLVEVLRYLVADTDIELLIKYVPHIPLPKVIFDKKSGTECLEYLHKELGVSFFFDGKKMYAGLIALKQEQHIIDNPTLFVKYRLGWNVIKDGNLKFRKAKNDDVVVVYIGEKKDGTKEKVTHGKRTYYKNKVIKTKGSAGNTGETVVKRTHFVTDKKALALLAKNEQAKLSYDGYEGKITTFGIPFCQHNWVSEIDDKKYTERNGQYLVESIEVNYGMSGFRRIVGIGLKLSE